MSSADTQLSLNINNKNFDITNVPATTNIAIFATYKCNQAAIDDVCFYIENNLSDIIQLPELFFVDDKSKTAKSKAFNDIEALSCDLIIQISTVLRPFQYVCTSLILDGIHQAVLINNKGIYARQKQINPCKRYQWSGSEKKINIVDLPLEQGSINVAMLTGDDALDAELATTAALKEIHALLVPFDIQTPHQYELSLLTLAAEHRICIIAASREKSFVDQQPNENKHSKQKLKQKLLKSTGLIINLPTKATMESQIASGKYKGTVESLLVKHQQGKITKALLFPVAACYKITRS